MKSTEAEVEIKDEKYLDTIRNLRRRNFTKNLPFLILSDELPEGQVYREFPDGRVELQEVFIEGAKFKSKVIEVLRNLEADRVRRAYGLL